MIALSTAESELYAAVKAATEGIGVQSLANELLDEKPKVKLHVDSSSAIAIMNRKGLGKAKHIELQDLWLQDAVRAGKIKTLKIWGEINPADLFTKHLSQDKIDRHMAAMGFRFIVS